MFIFTMAVAGAFDFPNILAGGSIQANDIVAAGMNQLPVELALVQYRRGSEAELDFELAIAFLGVKVPNFFTVKIVASKIAGADERVDVFTVRRRGGGSSA